jgi:hypothetical protein
MGKAWGTGFFLRPETGVPTNGVGERSGNVLWTGKLLAIGRAFATVRSSLQKM